MYVALSPEEMVWKYKYRPTGATRRSLLVTGIGGIPRRCARFCAGVVHPERRSRRARVSCFSLLIAVKHHYFKDKVLRGG